MLTGTISTSSSIGTPGFQPKEQLQAGEIDESVDVYALGCMFVELFGERKNWEGLSALQILMKVAVEGHVPDYSHLPDFVNYNAVMAIMIVTQILVARRDQNQ